MVNLAVFNTANGSDMNHSVFSRSNFKPVMPSKISSVKLCRKLESNFDIGFCLRI